MTHRLRVIDDPPVDVPRAKAQMEKEREAVAAELLNFDHARLEALNSIDAWIDLFGPVRFTAMVAFKVAEKAR